jgi:hypothetical protein
MEHNDDDDPHHHDDDRSLLDRHDKQILTTSTAVPTTPWMTTLKPSSGNSDNGSPATTNSKNNQTSTSRKSKSIPLPRSHVHRTQSEVQLCEDMETAERRDLNMFYRLVNGIRERQTKLLAMNDLPNPNRDTWPILQQHQPSRHINLPFSNYDPTTTQYCLGSREAESCVAHIIHTRNDDNNSTNNIIKEAYLPSKNNIHNVHGSCAMPASEMLLRQVRRNPGSTSDPNCHPKGENGLGEWWSLSGFDEDVPAPLSNSSISKPQLHQQPFSTTMEDRRGAKDDDDDEGIFDLDF